MFIAGPTIYQKCLEHMNVWLLVPDINNTRQIFWAIEELRQGLSYRKGSEKYGISTTVLQRHSKPHLMIKKKRF